MTVVEEESLLVVKQYSDEFIYIFQELFMNILVIRASCMILLGARSWS